MISPHCALTTEDLLDALDLARRIGISDKAKIREMEEAFARARIRLENAPEAPALAKLRKLLEDANDALSCAEAKIGDAEWKLVHVKEALGLK